MLTQSLPCTPFILHPPSSKYQGRPQTANALYSLGFELAPWDEPTPRRFFHLHSRSFKSELEVIEAIGNVIKAAHAPIPVNVVTWDASLRLETINCEGQMECGTVKCDEPGNFKFLVFAGPGLIKWQGERHEDARKAFYGLRTVT